MSRSPSFFGTARLALGACVVMVASLHVDAGEAELRAELDALRERVEVLESENRHLRDRLDSEQDAWLRGRRADEVRALVEEAIAGSGLQTAGLENGRFFLQSSDGRYRLNVGGRVQARYEYRSSAVDGDTSSFFLRRVRLDFRGHLGDERLTFRIMPELAGTATLRDGWINWAFDRALQVRVGQFAGSPALLVKVLAYVVSRRLVTREGAADCGQTL